MTPAELRTICREYGIPVTITGFVDEAGASKLIPGCPCRTTLRLWRRANYGPAAVQIGTRWYYGVSGLAAYLTPATKRDRTRQCSTGLVSDDGADVRDDGVDYTPEAAA